MNPKRPGLGMEATMVDVIGSAGNFQCPRCNYSNTSKSKVKRHLRHHMDSPKTFGCRTCRYTFAEKHQLKRHMALKNHGSVRRISVFPLTPKMIVKPKAKVVDEEKAANLAAAEEEVTSHKRALEKRQNLKKKIIEMKIVAQREEIMRGRSNLQNLLGQLQELTVEMG